MCVLQVHWRAALPATTRCAITQDTGTADVGGTAPDTDTDDARAAAATAMRRLRDAAGHVLATLADAQPVAPHHLLALRMIADGARTPGDLAAATGRHASSVSRVVDQLVDDGLARRAPHPEDRRQVLVTLTDDGVEVVDRFVALDGAISARIVAGFDAVDARRLAGFLDRMAANATQLASDLEDDPDLLDAFR